MSFQDEVSAPGKAAFVAESLFNVNILGAEAAQRALLLLGDAAENRIMRPIMAEAARILTERASAEAPEETGLLRLSLGATPVKSYGGKTLFATVGVRRGFRRAVEATYTKNRVRYLSAERSALAGDDAAYRDPVRYLHLVSGGRQAVSAQNVSILYSAAANRFLGRSVPEAKANPFMDRAFAGAATAIVARAEAVAAAAVATEVAKAA